MDPLEQVISRGFNRPSEEILLDLVNTYNGIELQPNEVHFGSVSELNQREDLETDADTFVSAEIVEDINDNFPGEDGFMFRRIPLERLIAGAQPLINPTADIYETHDVIDQINYQFSSQLTAEDLINDSHLREQSSITIRVSPDSKVWVGGFEAMASDIYKVVYIRATDDNHPRVTDSDQIRQI